MNDSEGSSVLNKDKPSVVFPLQSVHRLQRQICAVVASLSGSAVVPGQGFLQVGHGSSFLQVNDGVALAPPRGLLGAAFF